MRKLDPETRFELNIFFAGIAIGLLIGFLGFFLLIRYNFIQLC
jgi:ABC-type Mn2+/Zn2+ transport system permease subunit